MFPHCKLHENLNTARYVNRPYYFDVFAPLSSSATTHKYDVGYNYFNLYEL